MFANPLSDMGLKSRIYRALRLNNGQKPDSQTGKRVVATSPEKSHKWPTSTGKDASAPPIIREVQIRIAMKYCLPPTRLATIKPNQNKTQKMTMKMW